MKRYFVAGGTLDPTAPSYIKRPADSELIGRIQDGELCFILNTRQFGKSSLVAQTIYSVQQSLPHILPIFVDFSSMGMADIQSLPQDQQGKFEEQWYTTLLYLCTKEMTLSIDPLEWWQTQSTTYGNRFKTFLKDVILKERDEKIVFFFDEVDSIINYRFSDDFFALIRAIHNEKAMNPDWQKISFVLIGAAAPHDLISSSSVTPFNVGRAISLNEFSLENIFQLKEGLAGNSDELLRRTYHWTSGHPYLTQRICQTIVENEKFIWSAEDVDEVVWELFLNEGSKAQENNLLFAGNRVLKNEHVDPAKLLKLYKTVYQNKKTVAYDRNAIEQTELLLSGLLKVNNENVLEVRNKIYKEVFNSDWIDEHLPFDKLLAFAMGAIGLAFVLIVFLAVTLINRPQNAEIVAQTHIDTFQSATDPGVQMNSLARLLEIEGYGDEVTELYFSLAVNEQVALFQNGDNQSEGLRADAFAVLQHVYREHVIVNPAFPPPNSDTAVLKAMEFFFILNEAALSSPIHDELTAWIEGRETASQLNFSLANSAYREASHLGDELNTAVIYERGVTLLMSENYVEALQIFDSLYRRDKYRDLVTARIQESEPLQQLIGKNPETVNPELQQFAAETVALTPTNESEPINPTPVVLAGITPTVEGTETAVDPTPMPTSTATSQTPATQMTSVATAVPTVVASPTPTPIPPSPVPASPTSPPPPTEAPPPTQPPPPSVTIDNLANGSQVTSPLSVQFHSSGDAPAGWTPVLIVQDPVGGLWSYRDQVTPLGNNQFWIPEVNLGNDAIDCDAVFTLYAYLTPDAIGDGQVTGLPTGSQTSLSIIRDCPNTVAINSPQNGADVASPLDVQFTVSGIITVDEKPIVFVEPPTGQLFVWQDQLQANGNGNFTMPSVNLGVDESDCNQPFKIHVVLTKETIMMPEITQLPSGPQTSISVTRSCN